MLLPKRKRLFEPTEGFNRKSWQGHLISERHCRTVCKCCCKAPHVIGRKLLWSSLEAIHLALKLIASAVAVLQCVSLRSGCPSKRVEAALSDECLGKCFRPKTVLRSKIFFKPEAWTPLVLATAGPSWADRDGFAPGHGFGPIKADLAPNLAPVLAPASTLVSFKSQ